MRTRMKKHSTFKHILVFVLAQVAWLMLMGIWIYWYVSNYIIYEKVEDQLSPLIAYDGVAVLPFVGGIVLLVAISVGMSLIFRNLNIQLKLTGLYDNFIGNITHELKSPLSSIHLLLETMKSRDVPVEKQKEFIDLMIKDAKRLKNLIDSILEISALEQKKVSHNYQVHDINPLVSRIVHDSIEQYQLPEENVVVEAENNYQCVADANALKIVFNNLFDNAVKYSIDKPKINICTQSESGKFFIKFTDSGIGINPRDQKQIFKKFHRIYSSDIPNVKGSGLGLYWVKEIMKHHGGDITAQSEGVGKGTTFKLELPLYKSEKNRYIDKLLKISSKRKEQSGDRDESK